MDNPLTPNKIQRLINLAEDRSFNMPRRLLINDDDLKRLATTNQAALNRTNTSANCESSSGILDLDRMEGFGESGFGELSLSKSTNFNPGELTGRSTGTEEVSMPLGRHSIALENITSQMDKQTSEIQDIMRHSIATNYSFHSKRDLTADEISLVAREAPLPIQNHTQIQFTDSMSLNNSNLSVGAYFKNRCPDFGRMLSKTDSPDRSCMPSISEVSGNYSDAPESLRSNLHSFPKMDQTLDCVPVRQPRNNMENMEENPSNIDLGYAPMSSFTIPTVDKLNEPSNSKANSSSNSNPNPFYMSQVPDKPKYVQMSLNSVPSQKITSTPLNKDTNMLIKNLQASLRLMGEDTEGSVENSFSISKIADYLGKQSNVSVTDMLQYNNQKKQVSKKQPLMERHMNIADSKKINKDIEVTNLRDSRKTDMASSSSTVNTVISLQKYKANNEQNLPTLVVTEHLLKSDQIDVEDTKRTTRSKSPSSKSHSTFTTVQENVSGYKSADSPLHSSKGEANTSHVHSPNVVYKELDKSVDWHEVMQQKHLKQDSLAKEQWVEISAPAVTGYVGACCPVVITVTTLTDSWLTAKLQFTDLPDDGNDITIELPRMPLLLSPGKTEKITLNITSSVEIITTLNFTISLKDTAVDGDFKQYGNVNIDIKMPVIQAMSSDGVNKITFPPIHENTSLMKSFVLISSCPADLQLVLSIVDGDSTFTIKSVQEIKKSDVNKVLMDQQGSTEETQSGKAKFKATNKQLCRLTAGNAMRVTIKFHTPIVSTQIAESLMTYTGILNVNLIGISSVLRRVDLIGAVGTVNLVMKTTTNKLQLSHDPTNVDLVNSGSIPGTWVVKFKTNTPNDTFPFKIAPSKFEIRPGCTQMVGMAYTGPTDTICEATLTFEEVTTGHKTSVEISGGSIEKPKTFPIKTNYNNISWVRSGRKELSLKNATNKKIYIRCQIVGDGFAIDLPRESRGVYCVTFGPCECRPLPIIFAPNSNTPHKATLHLVYDKNSDYSRKICLYGCSSGESMRWSGLVTYGDTALVRAVSRTPINLELYNKSPTPTFVSARVHFNLQYMCLTSGAELLGRRNVVRARSRHVLSLRVSWPALERRARMAPSASALATLTVLTGAESTRRRILKILRDESSGTLDTSLLPDHLRVLAEKFEGEDEATDQSIADFKETKASLNELIGGLQELTAQIDLPQDFGEENTILIDDTMVEHHTLCD